MLEKSGNFAHASRTGENLRLIWVSEVGVAKWLDSATYKYSAECASSYVSRTCTKIGTHLCNLTIPTKKSLGTKSETQQEVGYFEFSHQFCVIFAIFRCHTLTNSSQRFIQMNTKIGQCNLKPFVTLNCEDLEFHRRGVSVASCQILMFRHETGSCYISGMLCPIYTKLHMFDKNPELKRSK